MMVPLPRFEMILEYPCGHIIIIALISGIQKNTSMTTLYLDSNIIGDAGAKAIGEALEALKGKTNI